MSFTVTQSIIDSIILIPPRSRYSAFNLKDTERCVNLLKIILMPGVNSFSSNLINGLKSRIKKTFNNPYHKVGISWTSLKYLKHLPSGKVHAHNLLKHQTFFYGGMEFLHGVKEIFLEDVYYQQLPENAYILDCGAHIGLSVIYLKSICPSANIVCFEPDNKNFELLQKNIGSHNLKNVEARNEAVWTENTSLQFLQEGNMSSKISENTNSNTVSVKASRLKDFLNKHVDFLKLDIEGAEYKVLKDIAERLNYIDKMFIEYHGTFDQNKELLEILELISDAGFKFYIKEAAAVFEQPFLPKKHAGEYDLQLNMFCFKEKK